MSFLYSCPWRIRIPCQSLINRWLGYLGYLCGYGYGSIPINTISNGMNIHLPAILGFTRGTRVLTHPHMIHPSHPDSWSTSARSISFTTTVPSVLQNERAPGGELQGSPGEIIDDSDPKKPMGFVGEDEPRLWAYVPGLVNIQKAMENGPVEIVDFPSYKMVIFHCYVSSPEGNQSKAMERVSRPKAGMTKLIASPCFFLHFSRGKTIYIILYLFQNPLL